MSSWRGLQLMLVLPPCLPTPPRNPFFPLLAGGYCGVDPPTCEPEEGCRILRPDPPFLTNATGVAFAFSAMRSPGERMLMLWFEKNVGGKAGNH